MIRVRLFLTLCTLFYTTACASLPPAANPPGIGPYHSISARLLVIEPKRRWQVMLDWQANQTQGHARLVHAASGNIVELRWKNNHIRLRDNHTPAWRDVNMQQLAEHGIVISPHTLAVFLTGNIPSGFHETAPNTWENRNHGAFIRVIWKNESKRLVLSDIHHGRRATLIILKSNPPTPASDGKAHD